jgi:hypothetical protein
MKPRMYMRGSGDAQKKGGSEPGGSPLPRGKGVVGGTTPRIVLLQVFWLNRILPRPPHTN